MNLDQIASRIAHPDSCLGSEIPALKTLTEKYPFAQVFSILYLKALSNQNDIGFDEALQKHAYRVTDRMKLYDLIHSVTEQDMVLADQPVESDIHDVPVESMIDNSGRDAINRVSTGNQSTENVIEPISENIEQIENEQSIAKNTDPVKNVIKSEEIVLHPEIDAVLPLDPPPKGENLKNSTDNNEISPSEISTDFIHDEVELEIISQVVATVYNDNLEHSIPEKPIEEKKSEPLITPVPESKTGNLEEKRSFSSWLKAGNQNLSSTTNQAVEEIKKEVKPTEKQIDKIIDQFIEKEPTISRPKKEFYSPTKKAKESVSSEGMIYTETLADIFAIQGNFPKAITAYEQLMLTNPEKKIFFAQRIKELKEKLNT